MTRVLKEKVIEELELIKLFRPDLSSPVKAEVVSFSRKLDSVL
jgi:hypothetical protein